MAQKTEEVAVSGTLALVGGGEFRPGCEAMDAELLELNGSRDPSVLVVPTAASMENPLKAAENGVRYFTNLGAKALGLMVLESSHANDPTMCISLEEATHVYLTGGSPAHLLGVLKDSLFLEKLKEWLEGGGVLAGSSAGAMVMGSLMRRPGEGTWVEALGLAGRVAVLPHHESSVPADVARGLEGVLPENTLVLGIDGMTGCVGGSWNWRVVGTGRATMYQGGKWRTFNQGEELPTSL